MREIVFRLRSMQREHCPFCHEQVVEEAQARRCGTCLASQHEACWEEHGACAACRAETEPLPLRFRLIGAFAWGPSGYVVAGVGVLLGGLVYLVGGDVFPAVVLGLGGALLVALMHEKVVQQTSPTRGASLEHGWKLLDADRADEALGYLQRAVREGHDIAVAELGVCMAYMRLGLFEDARGAAKRLQQQPVSTDLMDSTEFCQGVCALYGGDRDSARSHFERTVSLEGALWLALLGSEPATPSGLSHWTESLLRWARGELSLERITWIAEVEVGQDELRPMVHIQLLHGLQAELAGDQATAKLCYQRALERGAPPYWSLETSWAMARLREWS